MLKLSPTSYLDGVKAPPIIFADEGHGAQKRENRVLQTGHAPHFFEEKLIGAKAEQKSP